MFKNKTENQETVVRRQRFFTQYSENMTVKEELDKIETEGGKIFKLVGPVLFEQDLTEAQSTVSDRLTFLQGELYVSFFSFSFLFLY